MSKGIRGVIFVTVSMAGGGTERVISILANKYCELGIPVTILMIAGSEVAYELDNRIQLINVSGATRGSLIGRVKRVSKLRTIFRENKDAKIIAMGTVAAMFALLSKIGLRNKIVVSERNDPNRLNHRPIRFPEKVLRNLLYRGTTRLVLQTEDVKSCFPQSLIRKSIVILNPISESLPETAVNDNREKTVITAGRLTEQKNHKLLIDAFKDFESLHPGYRLRIFGEGELKGQLQDYIINSGLQGKAYLEGFSKDLYGELQKGGIYVSSSDWEGISNSLVEAMAMGIPTVATDCPMGGSRMFIDSMKNGILVPMNDKAALVEAMSYVADHVDEVRRISQNAMEIREKLAAEKIAGQWLELFEE